MLSRRAALMAVTLTPAVPSASAPLASPDSLDRAISGARAGSTVVLEGAMLSVPLKRAPKNLTVDLRKATITGDTRIANPNGLTLIGGTWTGAAPITVTGGEGFTMIDPAMAGPEPRPSNAMAFVGVKKLSIQGASVSSYKNGIAMVECDGFEVVDCGFEGMRVDGIQCASVWNGKFIRVSVHGTRRSPGAHGDGIQIRNLPDKRGTSNLLFDGCWFVGDTSGINFTRKKDQPTFENVTIRGTRARVAFPGAIALLAVNGVTLEDNEVSTYPGAVNQSRIYIADDCTNVRYIGRNLHNGYRNKKAVSVSVSAK